VEPLAPQPRLSLLLGRNRRPGPGHSAFCRLWAGCRYYYAVFSREVGFAGMVLVTITIAAVALGRDSQRIAMLSMLGGFLTPLLVSTWQGRTDRSLHLHFHSCAGLLIMAWRRDWRWLAPVSFVLTQFYFWGWYDTFYQANQAGATLAFATLFLSHFIRSCPFSIPFAPVPWILSRGFLISPKRLQLPGRCLCHALASTSAGRSLACLGPVRCAPSQSLAFFPPRSGGEIPLSRLPLRRTSALTFATWLSLFASTVNGITPWPSRSKAPS